MGVGVVEQDSKHQWPLRVRGSRPSPQAGVRTIRVGLLGLGQVGQAVARLAADWTAAADAGLRFRIEQALVRDVAKVRRCAKPPRLTTNPSAFMRGQYDVVIEALDAVEPARTLVARLLGRGTSVVTANKALVAAHGSHLEAIAAARGCTLRYEATALAAVPFLGTLAARPLVASVTRLLAIVNGTTNFILSSLAEGTSFDAALARARELGYAEPDASRDLDGHDAADKLVLLTSLFGWGRLSHEPLEVSGIRSVTPDDLAAARAAGGTIKPVVSAERDATGVQAFVGPAFVPAGEPLASLGGALNGIRLDGRFVSNLFFSGPGAGPGVTAATLLDDAIEATRNLHPPPLANELASYGEISAKRPSAAKAGPPRSSHLPHRSHPRPAFPSSPCTSWFVRVMFPGVLPAESAVAAAVAGAGLRDARVSTYASHTARWLFVGPHSRREIDAAIDQLAHTHRVTAVAFRIPESR
jgi:homoserine dehydrogenase